MSPRELMRVYSRDERLNTGRFFSSGGLEVSPGDHVGVVLMVPGAPKNETEVADYIYRRMMGPSRAVTSAKVWMRHALSLMRARLSAGTLTKRLDSIGGGTAIERMNREQAEAVQRCIRSRTALPDSVRVSTYLGSPFGSPELEETASRMVDDHVTHVILLPLFPQYASGTTGRGLAEWEAMLARGSLPRWPTVAVWEFARNEKYVQAICDRIDQALQRFPKHIRDDVHLLFAAHGRITIHSERDADPYCCLVHNTVDSVMERRSHDRLFTLSFVRDGLFGNRLSSDLATRLAALKKTGCRAVLVIPVDYVSEQFDTSYLLDVRLRDTADESGIVHYHVMTGLNCHPLFIESVSDMIVERITAGRVRTGSDQAISCPRHSWRSDAIGIENRRECGICPYHGSQSSDAQQRGARSSERPSDISPGERLAAQTKPPMPPTARSTAGRTS
ncbi:MAG: ferrochelatase [Rhodothermales bacterium]|nr:ferrochelatase [Rhodothermales bacterium]